MIVFKSSPNETTVCTRYTVIVARTASDKIANAGLMMFRDHNALPHAIGSILNPAAISPIRTTGQAL